MHANLYFFSFNKNNIILTVRRIFDNNYNRAFKQ